MDNPPIISLPQLLFAALQQYFSSDRHQMAASIGCSEADLVTALTMEGARKGAACFEKLCIYCINNNLSIDTLFQKEIQEC